MRTVGKECNICAVVAEHPPEGGNPLAWHKSRHCIALTSLLDSDRRVYGNAFLHEVRRPDGGSLVRRLHPESVEIREP